MRLNIWYWDISWSFKFNVISQKSGSGFYTVPGCRRWRFVFLNFKRNFFEFSKMHLSLHKKTLVRSSLFYKNKLGQIIPRKVVVLAGLVGALTHILYISTFPIFIICILAVGSITWSHNFTKWVSLA